MVGRVGGIADWPLPGSRNWYRMVHCREGLRLPTKNNTSARHPAPKIRAACVPRDERHAARVPRAHRQAAYALRTCALRTAQESLFIHNANSHTTHTAREVVVRGSPSVSMGRLDAWRSAAWRVCRLKRRLLHGPRRCPQSRSPANGPRALVGLAVDDIWSGEADNLSERGAR